MGKAIIITVGRSIFEKKDIIPETDNLHTLSKRQETEGWLQRLCGSSGNTGNITRYSTNIRNAIANLKRIWNGTPLDFKKLPAELASLARFMGFMEQKGEPLNKEHDRIHLLYSETHVGVISAILLEKFLKDNVACNTCKKMVEGLGDNENIFKEKGLRNLVDEIAIISEQSGGEVHIIATGGYKPESIYASITGMLRRRPVYYLHEGFQNIIDLPVLPIKADFDLWRENAVRIELVIGRPVSEASRSCENIDETIRGLIYEDNGVYRWKAAGEMLYKAYQDAGKWSSLQARGRSLLSYFNNNELMQRYQRYLEEFGDAVWIGDKVPEMVDHASRHHYNLFEIAESFLSPLLKEDPDLMTSEEIYVLLCVILLHDCGHSLSRFPSADYNLSPTEIRKWHNILGYERLNPEHDYSCQPEGLLAQLTSLWKGGNVTVAECDMWDFWKQELETIATIGLYHRREMPLTCGEHVEERIPICEGMYYPLNNKNLCFHNARFTDRAVKIAALFRIIDNCDTQLSRAGTKRERDLRKDAAGYDIAAEEEREEEVRALLSEVLKLVGGQNTIERDLFTEIAKGRELNFKKEHGMLNKDDKKKLEDDRKELKQSVDSQICKISDETNKGIVKRSVQLVREISDRVNFKKNQESHFEKHSKVEKVTIIPKFSNGEYKFIVELSGAGTYKKDLEDIKRGMEEEYKAAKDVLNNYKIMIEYKLV